MKALVQVDGLEACLPPEGDSDLPSALRGRPGPEGRRWRLAGVSFRIDAGECLAIAGEDGSGKALLCAALLGLVPRAAGEVRVAEVELSALRGDSARRFRRRYQAVFPDGFGQLAAASTVDGLLGQALDLWHRPAGREARRALTEEAMALCEIPEALRRLRPAELDAVERQRVALARAALCRPDWLILHDYVRGLDALAAAELLGQARRIAERLSCAVLFLTGDLAEAWQLGDSIGVFHRGRLVEIGPAERITTRPRHPGARRLVGAAL